MKVLVSVSKKKGGKKKTGRSLMLSTIMPFLSGDLGEQIQTAVEKEEGEKVEALMKQVGAKLRAKFESTK
jgi:hypothetical protein